MEQFRRKIRLKVKGSSGSVEINSGGFNKHDLKIEFDIEKDLASSANEATIKIWNLSESTRNSIGKQLDEVTLEAGYTPPGGGDNVGIIFKGSIRNVEHSRDGPDIITTLTNGDGDKALNNATISKSYKAGTKASEVIEDLQKELEKEGVTKGEIKLPEDIKDFKRPYAMVGTAKNELDILGRTKNFFWSIQNGAMEIIPGNGYIGTITRLSPDSGLVGTPTITDNGVKCSALLNPEIRPGRRVKIESQVLEMNAANGEYRVAACRYSGDNRDGDFIVYLVGESLKDGKVDEGKQNVPASNSAPSNVAQDYATGGLRGDK